MTLNPRGKVVRFNRPRERVDELGKLRALSGRKLPRRHGLSDRVESCYGVGSRGFYLRKRKTNGGASAGRRDTFQSQPKRDAAEKTYRRIIISESEREVSMREAILITLTFAMFSMAATVITFVLIRP